MNKGDLAIDPRGLIFEAYRIDGIGPPECRSIFLDWALGVPQDDDMMANIAILMDHYGTKTPDHPMTQVLRDGLSSTKGVSQRRGGRNRRRTH